MSIADVSLTAREKEGIRRAVEKACAKVGAEWKRISLFGSRVNPAARGGDIDLYVEIAKAPGRLQQDLSTVLRIALEDEFGERKVDLVIDDGGHDLGAFGEIVKTGKVDLWTTG